MIGCTNSYINMGKAKAKSVLNCERSGGEERRGEVRGGEVRGGEGR